jgi:hypothetical protein
MLAAAPFFIYLQSQLLGPNQKFTKGIGCSTFMYRRIIPFDEYFILNCTSVGRNERLPIHCCCRIVSSAVYTINKAIDNMFSFRRSLGENFATRVLPVFISFSALGCAASINFSGGRYGFIFSLNIKLTEK